MNIKAASFDLKSFKFLLEVSRVRKYILIIIWLSRNKFQIQKRASENHNTKLFLKKNSSCWLYIGWDDWSFSFYRVEAQERKKKEKAYPAFSQET